MKLVVDTNILFSFFNRKSTARDISTRYDLLQKMIEAYKKEKFLTMLKERKENKELVDFNQDE